MHGISMAVETAWCSMCQDNCSHNVFVTTVGLMPLNFGLLSRNVIALDYLCQLRKCLKSPQESKSLHEYVACRMDYTRIVRKCTSMSPRDLHINVFIVPRHQGTIGAELTVATYLLASLFGSHITVRYIKMQTITFINTMR